MTECVNLAVQLALSLALRLRLAGESEVSEVELGALCVRSKQLRFLGVQEGEGLRARPVRLHTHLDPKLYFCLVISDNRIKTITTGALVVCR